MPYGEADYPKTKRGQQRLFDQILAAGKAGKSHAQMADKIGISRDTLAAWIGNDPELSRIVTVADDFALAWWEALGQRQAETREGNSSVFIFVMKNRFEKDYGKDALGPAQVFEKEYQALPELSRETRDKLRMILRAESLAVDKKSK